MNKPLQVSFFLISSAISTPLLAVDTHYVAIDFTDEIVCPSPRIDLPSMLVNATEGSIEEQETIIEGDAIDSQGDDHIVLSGNSQIVQGKRGVFADQIIYDAEKYQATVNGKVRFYTVKGDEIKTESMRLEVDTFIGETGPGEMRLVKRGGIAKRKANNYVEDFSIFAPFFNRAEQKEQEIDDRPVVETRVYADQIEVQGQDFQRLTNARLTRCPEGNSDIMIIGKEVELDHATGVGYAKNVSVKFKGVPILYAPRLSFPINDERKSGVLAPSVGSGDDSGTILSVPYYFNLAPNYDATARGTYMTKRGVQLYSQFRYLSERGNGTLKAEYLPGDDAFDGEDRYAIGLDYKDDYSNGWRTLIDLQDVSDTQYLNDFRNDIGLSSATHLPQRGQVNYSNTFVSTNILASKYQTVNDAFISFKPYDRLPRITFNVKPWEAGPIKLGLDSEYVAFSHDDNTKLSGIRLNIEPFIALSYESIYGFVRPKISLNSLSYDLDNAPRDDDSPSVTVPKLVIDAGVYLERDVSFAEKKYLHTLEPRITYVNVGKKDQTEFPNFDTGQGSVSSFSYLSRDDRFFGGDRIGDDHHIALGVTSRLIHDETGAQKMSASMGQLFYLEDRTVSLSSNDTSLTESKSDIFAQLDAQLTENFSVNSFLRYDVSEGETGNLNLGLDYDSGSRREASLDYFQTKDSSEDVRLGLNWPLTPHLQFGYSQRYSLKDSQERSSSIKLVYDSCCWAVGLTANRLLQSDGQSDGEYRNSILVTFELNGLGRIQSTVQ